MQSTDLDVLMITYNRPRYTELALSTLIARSAPSTRIWVWHNGNDKETLDVVNRLRPQFHRFYHSAENLKLTTPTNWLLQESTGKYISKVDDDCLVPTNWDRQLIRAHEKNDNFGVIGCWRFLDEDFVPELAHKKIRTFNGDVQLMVNFWVEGSGYVMKRNCFESLGPLAEGQSFTDYCIKIARNGWVNGWIYPFLYQEHMDDPRAPSSALRTDQDLLTSMPLSARRNNVSSLEEWTDQLRRSALKVQKAPIDPAYWHPWRRKIRRLRARLLNIARGKQRHW